MVPHLTLVLFHLKYQEIIVLGRSSAGTKTFLPAKGGVYYPHCGDFLGGKKKLTRELNLDSSSCGQKFLKAVLVLAQCSCSGKALHVSVSLNVTKSLHMQVRILNILFRKSN